jgi:hypothetical protein
MSTATVNGPDPADMEYEATTIEAVEPGSSGWTIKRADGWSFWIGSDSPIEPRPGMHARFYGWGIGHPVRGLVLDGVTIFYRTAAEEEARHRAWCDETAMKRREAFEAGRDELDRRVAALPEVFRRRIERFRAGNPDFRWEYEGYELICCETAVKIAETLGTRERYAEICAGEDRWGAVFDAVPGIDSGLSGNQFGAALSLAGLYLADPEMVVRQHGALVPLVGCEKYGCTHDASTEDAR